MSLILKEKANLLNKTCSDYLFYLESLKDSLTIVDDILQKKIAVVKALQALAHPEYLIEFKNYFQKNKIILEQRRDSNTNYFLKVILSICTLGIASQLGLWKVKGQEVTKQLKNITGQIDNLLDRYQKISLDCSDLNEIKVKDVIITQLGDAAFIPINDTFESTLAELKKYPGVMRAIPEDVIYKKISVRIEDSIDFKKIDSQIVINSQTFTKLSDNFFPYCQVNLFIPEKHEQLILNKLKKHPNVSSVEGRRTSTGDMMYRYFDNRLLKIQDMPALETEQLKTNISTKFDYQLTYDSGSQFSSGYGFERSDEALENHYYSLKEEIDDLSRGATTFSYQISIRGKINNVEIDEEFNNIESYHQFLKIHIHLRETDDLSISLKCN